MPAVLFDVVFMFHFGRAAALFLLVLTALTVPMLVVVVAASAAGSDVDLLYVLMPVITQVGADKPNASVLAPLSGICLQFASWGFSSAAWLYGGKPLLPTGPRFAG